MIQFSIFTTLIYLLDVCDASSHTRNTQNVNPHINPAHGKYEMFVECQLEKKCLGWIKNGSYRRFEGFFSWGINRQLISFSLTMI